MKTYKLPRGVTLSLVALGFSVAAANADPYICTATHIKAPELGEDSTVNGYAELRPEKRQPVTIDFVRGVLRVANNLYQLVQARPVVSAEGTGTKANIEGVPGGLALIRERENDDFFAVVMGPYQIVGNCPRP